MSTLPFTTLNLDLVDIHNIKDVWEHNGVIYSNRNAKMIKEQESDKVHIPSLLAAAVLGLNNTATPSRNTSKFDTMWTDIDAQELYLRAKPTCYIILGKPGLGAFNLGEALSKKYNCIHLCPMHIISDEISQESLTGKCLDFNLKHNVPCTHTTILKMLIQKLKSPAVKHRGYVISGIPLVNAYKTPNILIKSKHTEEAWSIIDQILFDVIYNLKRKKPKAKRVVSTTDSTPSSFKNTEEAMLEEEEEEEEHVEEEHGEEGEEEEIVAELPKFVLHTCLDVFQRRKKPFFNTQQAILLRQLQEVFQLSLKPDIIIYITCPDGDVLTKKKHKLINYKNNQNVMEPFPAINTSDIRWPTRYTLSDYENPYNVHVFNPKYSCRSPINFKTKSVVQVCNYRHYVLPFIEKQILDYDPNQVIKLNGRTSTYQMMHQISERLLLMHVHPVIIPEPLYVQEPPEDFEEFWTMVKESHVINSGVLKFGRFASPWFNRCPVELKKRQSVVGKPVLAVKFFKHIYIMSSLNNFVSFCRNPRPFLKLKYLEPTCRIIVTGTRLSGKTMTAECLSWIFDTPVISYQAFLETEKQKKYEVFSKRILSEIIATIEDARFMQWNVKENNRLTGLDEWTKLVAEKLNTYLPLLIQYTKFDSTIEEIDAKEQEENAEEIAEENAEEITKDQEENIEQSAKDQEENIEQNTKDQEENTEQIYTDEQETNTEQTDKTHRKKSPKKTSEMTKNLREEKKEVMDPSLKLFNSLREQLFFLPILDSIEQCEAVMVDQSILSQYAPLELRTIIEKPNLPVLGDADVTKAISEYIALNDLQKDIEPTTEELMDEIIQLISPMDIKHSEYSVTESYRKFIIDGFPSDPEYWEYLSDNKSMPDYTIAIMENREIVPELVHHYLDIENSVKNYQNILSLAKDPLIISKLQTKPLPEEQIIHNNMKIIIHDLINDGLDLSVDPENIIPEEKGEENLEFMKKLEESIETFRENWDNIKIKLEDISKCYIEVELMNKSDIEVLEEVLLKLRECYFIKSEVNEGEVMETDDENNGSKDLLSYNDSQNLCETNIYCPLTYFKYGLLWEGKPEFTLTFNDKIHYFAKEEYVEMFQTDITKYQTYNKPFKKIPKLKICVTGCIGSGKTSLSKQLAIELGLLHVDFQDVINNYYMPQHYKKVGRMYENPFTDEHVEEEAVVEFHADEENPIIYDEIVSNEIELRRMLYNYFERAQPVIPVYMQKIITKIWNDYPYIETGFVLDGYPRIPQDVEDMVECNCIPDLVIALDCDLDTSMTRVSPAMLNRWKSQLTAAKIAHRKKVGEEHKEWVNFITKQVVVEVIIEEILETICDDENPLSVHRGISGESLIIDAHPSGSANVNPNVFNSYNKMIEQYPEPKNTRQWDKPADELENINARIEAIQESEYDGLDSLKDLLEENKIKLISIDATKPFYKVYRLVLSKLTDLRNRSSSSLEQTFIIPTDIAELLLSQGYFFLSKFGRMCPVYIYNNPKTIHNNYKLSRRQGTLFPVIHRAYIYFISNKDNVVQFRTDPLKYVTSDSIQTYYHYPLTIGIIGAPKSGKSVLAANLARRHNLLCISRGMALRYIVNSLNWTELAFQITKKAKDGELVDNDSIMNAVQAVTIDHRATTYGFVFDGFPSTAYEAMALTRDGLYPNIIFDITSDKSVISKHSQKEIYVDIFKYKPPYSIPFMENRFTRWNEQCYKIRSWINDEFQNICPLNGNESKWQCLQNANNKIQQLETKIHYYLANYETNIVPAHHMLISNAEFELNQSSFKNMCPACLRKNIFRNSSYHGDKTGIVQYKNKFYWICADHLELVLTYPDYYLSKEIDIPEIPAVVKMINTNNVYENGICMVTYATNLPRQILEPGTNKFAATYKSKTYMFCSEECLHIFLDKPHMFSDITIFKGSSWFPRLSLKNLPDLGYLEQTLASILTEACCSVNAKRPKYPGLTFQLSARRVPVPDERFDYLCEFHKPASKVPAFLNVVDIAGLVRGAAEGQGLGNAFLSHIKACDAIFNLCRAFDDEDVIHVDGDVNPVRDLETIGEELRLKDEEQLMQNIEKLDRVVNRGNDKKLKPEYDTLLKIKTVLVDEKKHIRFGDWSAADIEILNKYLFLTSKPALYLVNLSEKDYIRKKNKWLPKLKEWIDKNDPGAPLIPFSGAFETKLVEMDPEERQAYLKENNFSSALDKIIVQGYKALQLEYFFTAGPDEVKAWTIQKGTKAPQAAGRIHTDFEKGFIMAEVMHYKDFKEEGTEAACKAAGKYRQQGRNYVVEDGDIIFFKFNAGAGLKDAKKK